ncbi:MAG: glycosyltransferase family 2 protein [Clostridiales bacterium]|nr:glycosyltransferase family 2 protein [Clostridiales bacterium]
MKTISVVAPMYNEESLVNVYCEEMLKVADSLSDKYKFEIILVNDGSRDGTYAKMLEQHEAHPDNIAIVCLTRNFGLEGAVSAGLRSATGDAVIVMDADLQDPPSLLPQMITKWENGADVVTGSRIRRSNDGLFKKAGAGFYYKVLGSLSGKVKLEKSAANFRLLSRKACDMILSLPEVNSVFRVEVPFIGMKTDVVEYDRDKRYAGKTKYNLKSMIPYALDSITGISIEPLRRIALLQIIPLLLFIGSIVGMILTEDSFRSAWLVLFFASILVEVLLIAICVMAEYIGQIMIEVKGRPTSLIYEYKPCKNTKTDNKGT